MGWSSRFSTGTAVECYMGRRQWLSRKRELDRFAAPESWEYDESREDESFKNCFSDREYYL